MPAASRIANKEAGENGIVRGITDGRGKPETVAGIGMERASREKQSFHAGIVTRCLMGDENTVTAVVLDHHVFEVDVFGIPCEYSDIAVILHKST